MNKLLLLTIAFSIFFISNGQNIPNGGFENWSYSNTYEHPITVPTVFNSSNADYFYRDGTLSLTKVAGASGYAFRLSNSITTYGDTARGMAAWGNVDNGINGGVYLPSMNMITGIRFKTRFQLDTTTPGFVAVFPTFNGDSCGPGNFAGFPGIYIYELSGTQSSWKDTSFTFNPPLTVAPDSCVIVFASADMVNTEKGTPGDFLEIDDVEILGTTDPVPGGQLDVWQNVPPVLLPDDWTVEIRDPNTLNYNQSTNSIEGDYSIELHNFPSEWGTRIAQVSLGEYYGCGDSTPCKIRPGMALPIAPESFGFYYKYQTATNDTASVNMVTTLGDSSINSYWQSLPATTDWVWMEIDMTTPTVADSAFISFQAGRWDTGDSSAILWLDGLKFHLCNEPISINGPSSVCSSGSDTVQFSLGSEFVSGFSWSTTTGNIISSTGSDTIYVNNITTDGTVSVIKSYNDGCPDSTFTFFVDTTSTPSIDAGADFAACGDLSPIQLSANLSGATGCVWRSTGNGTFTPDSTAAAPLYWPSPVDSNSGAVCIGVVTTGTGTCTPATDTVCITFTPPPVVFAGSDQTICANNPIISLNGFVAVASGVQWNGCGTFTPNPMTINPIYSPCAAEIANGYTCLTIESTGNGICSAAIDTMCINITPSPIVYAGADFSAYGSSCIPVNGTVTVATGGIWSSTGDGAFTSPTNLSTCYQAGSGDLSTGSVCFILTSSGNGNCNPISDTVCVSFMNTTYNTIDTSSCDSVIFNATMYYASTSFSDTVQSSGGADSIITQTNIIINNSYSMTVDTTGCDSILIGGVYQFSSGSSVDTFVTISGCDSIVTANYTVVNSTTSSSSMTACDSAIIGGTTYTSSQTLTAVVGVNSQGCDSIQTVTLTILNSSTTNQNVTACDMATINGNNYTSSQIVTDVFSGAAGNGCDSVVITDLTVNNSTSITIDTMIANGSSITIGSNTYNSDGTYIDTLMTTSGCDSIVTINLSVVTFGITTNNPDRLIIYPNPASHYIDVIGENEFMKGIKIINSIGQDVTNQTNFIQKEGILRIETLDLNSGIYIVKSSSKSTILIIEN